MGRRFYILICFVVAGTASFSQSPNHIKGKVTNASNGEPVINCSVFINSTSKGTITDTSGGFELSNISGGKYELIVSSIGYETYVYPFTANQLPLELNIRLIEKQTDLTAVTVEPFLKNGWETWGQTFIENLIGTTDYASECTIQNKEVVRFRFSQKANQLTAVADEPLIIENKALGYIIRFKLEEFAVNFNSQTNVYLGFPFFSDIPTQSKVLKMEWADKRKKAYFGSIIHFIRCLYNDEVRMPTEFNQEGFEIRKPDKIPNPEKLRVTEIYKVHQQQKSNPWPDDSLKYYKRVMQQHDSLSINRVLTAENLITSTDDQGKSLFFTGRLNVTYRRKRKLDKEVQRSTIYLVTPAPVQIEENGYYDSPLEIFTMGYWAKSQKLGYILPFDYWPEPE